MNKQALLLEARAALKAARDLHTKAAAANREMTPDERQAYQAAYDLAVAKKAAYDAAPSGTFGTLADLDALARGEGIEPFDFRYSGSKAGGPTPSRWAMQVLGTMQKTTSGYGTKALLTGTINTPPVVEVAALPDLPTRIVDLIPKETLDSNTFQWLMQTVKDSQAGVVADGGTKPTSAFTFAEAEGRARVIAHLSEPFPIRYMSDHAELGRILGEQMAGGVMAALEDEVVSGAGDGEHFTGLTTMSGAIDVSFNTDILTTCRSARTGLEALGEVPTGWAFNPADLQTIDLLREMWVTEEGGFMVNSATAATIFGNIPRISSLSVPVGTAILADWRQSAIMVREDVGTLAATQAMSGAVNLWETNQVVLRCEGRYGWKVRRPQAFAIVDLTEGS